MKKINIGVFGLLFILISCTHDHQTYIYDTNGKPIEGVTIKVNGENYKSDSLGYVNLHQTRHWSGWQMHFEEFKKKNHNYGLKSIESKNDTIRIILLEL